MEKFQLSGELRADLGKKATKETRANGLIPCVLYGGSDVKHFTVKEGDVRKLIYSPNVYVVELTIAGKTVTAILKDLQVHPVKDNILHIDFLEISTEKPVVIEIPIKLEGLAEGVKLGGKLSQQMRKLRVKGIYTNFPDRLIVNVENLGIGKSIQVGELSYENLELLNNPINVVATVKATRGSRANA